MNDTETNPQTTTQKRRWWQRRWLWWLAGIVAACAIVAVAALQYVVRNAEPILRKRIIETVSARFDAPVQLDQVDISVLKGLQVTGEGLRVLNRPDTVQPDSPDSARRSTAPILSVQKFQFRTDVRSLLHASSVIGLVYVQSMELHIPPAELRGKHEGHDKDDKEPRVALLVTHVVCDDAKLFIETLKPGKEPLEFDIQHLDLTGTVWKHPFHYDAILTNPKPTGLIHAVGTFGPWEADEPRDTPVDGDYNFSHADLNSIKGIGGMLRSTGHFAGPLGRVVVDGVTDTPNFSLDTSNHPVPLHTQFHAIVDGTTGDTTLDPVQAHLLHSDFTARGTVVRVPHDGHDIFLDVDMPRARIEDMLQLAVKTEPPLMRGALTMHTKLHIPPGSARVAQKLELAGRFQIRQVSFSNRSVQDKIDAMSVRAQGRPKEAQQAGSDRRAEVASDMKANFVLGGGMTTVHDLNYKIPGALVLLNGVYSLNGDVFEFKGHVRTDATASHMTTGWKSWLLKPVDPFLKKNGAGMELPVSISGTKGDVHFGLAMHGSSKESTEEMKQDLKNRPPARAAKKGAPSEARDEKRKGKQDRSAAGQQKKMDEQHRRALSDAASSKRSAAGQP